jgi:hypothetical protein
LAVVAPLSLPERTLEAWVSIVVARRFPHAQIWAPTAADTDDWDVAADVNGDGKVFVLENKGCAPSEANFRNPPADPPDHLITIDMRQLEAYVRNPRLAPLTYYVLPVPPWRGVPSRPLWPARRSPPNPPVILPVEGTARVGCERWIRVVAARDLQAVFAGMRRANHRSLHSAEVLQFGVTLDGFLRRVRSCRVGWIIGMPPGVEIDIVKGLNEPVEDGPGRAPEPRERETLRARRKRKTWRGQSSTVAVFVPFDDLPQ